MKTIIVIMLLGASLLAGCSHVISSASRQGALSDVPFREIKENPGSYLGSKVILGGKIVKTATSNSGSEIEVIQNPLDRFGYVTDPDVSEGRFLVLSPGQLDPEIFGKGRFITVAGFLKETRQGRIDDADYLFPVIDALEIHLWREAVPDPYTIWYYDPFFYPYYTSPYPHGHGPLIMEPHFYHPHYHR